MKGPKVNLDKDRFNGRTAVQQCWDYLNLMPECPWGIVSNIVSFRLYHRDHSPRKYELFTLQDINRKDIFDQFFYLFHKDGLLPSRISEKSRVIQLLDKSINRQEEVGDELYAHYNENRERMIYHLTKKPFDKDLNKAIRITQKILDRIIFIAFCEDRGLLPQNSIGKAHDNIPPFDKVTNPRWRNFKDLFYSIDKGNQKAHINPFNGGLFAEDPEVDDLELDDNWTDFFHNIGKYDFNAVVNVDVLGHLFEKSINDLEKLRLRGLFDQDLIDREAPKMTKSADRKKGGIYYTPPDFTQFIVMNTLGYLINDKFKRIQDELELQDNDIYTDKPSANSAEYWRNCFSALRKLKIIDPACGSGAFLITAFDLLEEHYLEVLDHLEFHDKEFHAKHFERIADYILSDNLHGIDLSSEAVEITQLALWIRSAQLEKSLTDLSKNIICGNSLITDETVDGNALIWEDIFPDYFTGKESGFDCVIGNPPWERIKLQEREYFDAIDPQIGSAVSAAKRRKLISRLKKKNLDKYNKYQAAKKRSEEILSYIRSSGSYPLTGKGDINYYSVFAELAKSLVSPQGRVGLLIPSGIATDFTNREFFSNLVEDDSLVYFYDFENKAPVFQDVHRSYKFSIFIFNGVNRKSESADFIFFARSTKDLEDGKRHIRLTKEDFEVFNPNTLTCPIFRSERDAQITKEIYKNIPILVNKNRAETGNPWGIKFLTMFHQTNDAELFITADELKKEEYRLEGNRWIKGDQVFLPLYEAKSIQAYDHPL
ncbi:MAG: N-6 DNA methylase [Candidatus Hatepunaea meridiana]|nr:N-6 DNA methylase [Candidatus Hatepunaea meridiana]